MVKLNEMKNIQFNYRRASNDLIFKLIKETNEFIEKEVFMKVIKNIQEVDHDWAKGENKGAKPVLDTVRWMVENVKDTIVATVGIDHWKAFILEYGMGSKMASGVENPNLSDYVSKYWHDARPSSGTIVTRQTGTVHTHPDWEKGSGLVTEKINHGMQGGINLEEGITVEMKNGYKKKTKVEPLDPPHVLSEAFENVMSRLLSRLQNVFDKFDWSEYLEIK